MLILINFAIQLSLKEMKYEVKKLYDEMMKQCTKIEEQKRRKEEEHERWRNQKINLEEENRLKSLDEQNKLKERFSLKQKQLEEWNEKWTSSVQDKDTSDPVSSGDKDDDDVVEKKVLDNSKNSTNEEEENDDQEEQQRLKFVDDKNDDDDGEMFNTQPTKKQKIESDLFGDSEDEDD